MENSDVYKSITHDVLLGDQAGTPESGIIPYINSVLEILIDEALRGRSIDERFGKHFRSNVKELIERMGS